LVLIVGQLFILLQDSKFLGFEATFFHLQNG
jgi:hypothetical protein